MSEEDFILENEIQRRQEVLDGGLCGRPKYKYVNGIRVTWEEYQEYLEECRIEDAKAEAELSFYRKCTSTGEEWETDSDGDYTPDWLYDKI